MNSTFKVVYVNENSSVNGKEFIVREDNLLPFHYLISDGESHIGGGKLLKKYCTKIDQ